MTERVRGVILASYTPLRGCARLGSDCWESFSASFFTVADYRP